MLRLGTSVQFHASPSAVSASTVYGESIPTAQQVAGSLGI
jgi:hypothetical protein